MAPVGISHKHAPARSCEGSRKIKPLGQPPQRQEHGFYHGAALRTWHMIWRTGLVVSRAAGSTG